MKKKVLAICDLEASYAVHFTEHVNRRGNIPFEIHAFTSTERLGEYLKDHTVEILLISEKAMCSEVGNWNIQEIVILSEDMRRESKERYPRVYKYQSSINVVREVLAVYGEKKSLKDPAEKFLKPKCRIIGVYSPVARCLKTSLALTLGQIAGRDRAALYMSFEEFAGFEGLLREKYERNISDVIYYLRQEDENIILKLSQIIQKAGRLDYIPPAHSPEDLRNVKAAEWHELLSALIEKSSYEVIILDIGDGLGMLRDFLSECDVIYMPTKENAFAKAKIQAFDEWLELWDSAAVKSRIRRLVLSPADLPSNRDRYVEQLVWTQLGETARELIKQDLPLFNT